MFFTRFPIASLSLWPLLVSALGYYIPRILVCLKRFPGFIFYKLLMLAEVVVVALEAVPLPGYRRLFSALQMLPLDWKGLEVP